MILSIEFHVRWTVQAGQISHVFRTNFVVVLRGESIDELKQMMNTQSVKIIADHARLTRMSLRSFGVRQDKVPVTPKTQSK